MKTATPVEDTRNSRDSDVNVVGVLGFGAGLLIACAIAAFMLLQLFGVFAARETRSGKTLQSPASAETHAPTTEPQLQTHPREDLRELREREDAILSSYGWVDRTGGIVRIPIRDAMKLIVTRGLPSRPAAATPPSPKGRK